MWKINPAIRDTCKNSGHGMTKHTESILGNIEIATLIPSSPQPVVPDRLEDEIAVEGLVGDG